MGLVSGYLAVAYLVMPFFWRSYTRRHPALDNLPGITNTHDGHPGDPLNVGLIGSESDLKRWMIRAGWYPADPITLKSCLEIAEGTVLKRPYDDAPVSALYLFGRKQDLAFEQPKGDSPRERHHVRFWRAPEVSDSGQAFWAGAATFDRSVGLSHTTGQITHHIAADIDAERAHVFATLEAVSGVEDVEFIDHFQERLSGKNGGGDPWHTDGRLEVGTLVPR